MGQYIWQNPGWPEFRWDSSVLLKPLGDARHIQGRLFVETEYIGLASQAEVLAEEALMTAAIEGEKLNPDSVRSSVVRRLGLPEAGLSPVERHVDGLVQMLLDATGNYMKPLDDNRLYGWHAALFPSGYSDLKKIDMGKYRTIKEPMQVVSGPEGREIVHYEAPPSDQVQKEMKSFLWWWASASETDGLLRAALAHFWFVSIHPFEDGNGRIARAITDMALAQDEKKGWRLYSMSSEIMAEQDDYYAILEKTSKGDGDITDWLVWFLRCLEKAVKSSLNRVNLVMLKTRFWQKHAEESLSKRQKKVLNRLLDAGPEGFEGGLNNRKYKGMTKVSPETAKRDLADLVKKAILIQKGGGRSTRYELIWPE
jgi:Fic family protein